MLTFAVLIIVEYNIQTNLSYSYLQVPASHEVNSVVQVNHSDTQHITRNELNQIVAQQIAHTLQQNLPSLLKETLQTRPIECQQSREQATVNELQNTDWINPGALNELPLIERLGKYYIETKQVSL